MSCTILQMENQKVVWHGVRVEKDQESITEDLALHPARDILLPGKAGPATQQAEQLAASAVAIAVTLGSFRDGDDQRNEEAEQSQPCKQDIEESQHQMVFFKQ